MPGLTLICRGAYRGAVEVLRDLLGLPISMGCVHGVLEAAARQASVINHGQDLSRIRVDLHDELFQGATPVLAGVDAASTSCYLLAAEDRRDADTWGVHLLDAAEQGLRPDLPWKKGRRAPLTVLCYPCLLVCSRRSAARSIARSSRRTTRPARTSCMSS